MLAVDTVIALHSPIYIRIFYERARQIHMIWNAK